MSTRLGLVGMVVAGCITAGMARAQAAASGAAGFTLAGTVVDPAGTPVVDAEVVIVQANAESRRLRSDTAGHFLAADLASPSVTVQVRRLGYEPRSVDVAISRAERRATIIIALEVSVAKLAGVSVVGVEDEPDMRLRDFAARKATNNFGHYVERSAIDTKRPQYISEMLRTIPGVAVLPSRRLGNTVRIRGCSPLVWVDGVRLHGAELDEVAQPGDVAAIEIYNAFAGIPAQFFDRSATCGTILVWTRSR